MLEYKFGLYYYIMTIKIAYVRNKIHQRKNTVCYIFDMVTMKID